MKSLVLVVLISLLSSYSISKKGVNFEHKQIKKEIASILKTDNEEVIIEYISEIEIAEDQPEGRFFRIMNNNSLISHLYVGRVYTCPVGGCDNPNASTSGGSFEYFDYLVIFDSSQAVSRIAVFNYQASHGQQICSKGWLRQFVGYSGSDTLKVGKNIDSISGATKSTSSITESVMTVQSILRKFIDES